jgi:4-amino-4-deoxy-L-arabinose transferase-like glycosyltransferase
MVFFLVLTAVLYFTVAQMLYGKKAALVSLFLLLAVPAEGFVMYGRHALGNVPALAYFLLGYWLWLVALEQNSWRKAAVSGLLFGLAAVTKGQYMLLIPAWLTVLLIDSLYLRQVGLKRILAVLTGLSLGVLVWYLVQIWLLGWPGFLEHLEQIRSSSAVTVTAFAPSRVVGSIWYLFRSGFILFVLPGFLYLAWLCRRRSQETARHIFLLIFVGGWLFWYAFISVGWARYAFESYAIGLMFTGKAVADSLTYVRRRKIALPQEYAKKVILALFLKPYSS